MQTHVHNWRFMRLVKRRMKWIRYYEKFYCTICLETKEVQVSE